MSDTNSIIPITVRAATNIALDGVTGRYFNVGRRALADPQAYDVEALARLCTLCVELMGMAKSV